jgi:hypothetical protein
MNLSPVATIAQELNNEKPLPPKYQKKVVLPAGYWIDQEDLTLLQQYCYNLGLQCGCLSVNGNCCILIETFKQTQ